MEIDNLTICFCMLCVYVCCLCRYNIVGVFCTDKLWGGQDHVFQFCDGLKNYEAHYNLSWFRPLLRGNSPMSSCLILKMNMCYKGVSRELEKFMW
jgi:hypothetical protein